MEQALSDLRTAVRDHDWHRVNLAVAAIEKALNPAPVEPDPVMSLEPVSITTEVAAVEGSEA